MKKLYIGIGMIFSITSIFGELLKIQVKPEKFTLQIERTDTVRYVRSKLIVQGAKITEKHQFEVNGEIWDDEHTFKDFDFSKEICFLEAQEDNDDTNKGGGTGDEDTDNDDDDGDVELDKLKTLLNQIPEFTADVTTSPKQLAKAFEWFVTIGRKLSHISISGYNDLNEQEIETSKGLLKQFELKRTLFMQKIEADSKTKSNVINLLQKKMKSYAIEWKGIFDKEDNMNDKALVAQTTKDLIDLVDTSFGLYQFPDSGLKALLNDVEPYIDHDDEPLWLNLDLKTGGLLVTGGVLTCIVIGKSKVGRQARSYFSSYKELTDSLLMHEVMELIRLRMIQKYFPYNKKHLLKEKQLLGKYKICDQIRILERLNLVTGMTEV